ncbi:MAG: hypothetical protein JXR78_08505 [Victivallales bacterium]|nr:hypothetical protein [Victivallales bacterium]
MSYNRLTMTVGGGIIIATILSGCVSPAEVAEIKETTIYQQQQIDQLEESIAIGQEQLEIIQEMLANKTSNPDDLQGQLVDAIMFILKNGNAHTHHNAISILGMIGGEKAESALLKLIKTYPNHSNIIVQALRNSRSPKIRGLIIDMIKNDRGDTLNNIAFVFETHGIQIFTVKDIPLLVDLLYSSTPNFHNRHGRNTLITLITSLDNDKGADLICKEILTTNPQQHYELISRISNQNIFIDSDNWIKLIDAMGFPDNANVNSCNIILNAIQRSGDWRITEAILPWADFVRTNNNMYHTYMNTLTQMCDPLAAPVLLKLIKNPNNRQRYNLNEFPGIVKQPDGEYTLVDDATMEKLLNNRKKRIASLKEASRRRRELLKKQSSSEKTL